MNKKEFTAKINTIFASVLKEMEGQTLEAVNMWADTKLSNVFTYAAISEKCMEKQLAELKGCERKYTFMHDFSIGEWCESWRGLLDTLRRCLVEYCDNEKAASELVLCVNWKAWEHHARGNANWAKLYSLLYDGVSGLMYEYYEGDEEKTSYMWHYLD